MLYKDFLKKPVLCPFCNLTSEEVFESNKFANLILAKAPYTRGHLLVVPKAHKRFMNELSSKEKEGAGKLLMKGLEKLHKRYKNVSILYREGRDVEVGKSVSHMHFHLIPDMILVAADVKFNKRKIFSEKEYLAEIKRLKKVLDS